MSYLVLARKHRPATFEQVVGQQHITRTLAGALASGRLAHAFCFTGPRGVGKTSVARILAKALNCETGPTEKPCGKCVHCREIDEGRAVDVQEIDAASNSRVEDVRELREMIRYRPQASRFRVTILDEVHMLSKAAFNALLKTLEEPPDHAVFILATTDAQKVPLTILSRCQRYDFRRLPPKALAEHLADILAAEGCGLEPASLALMAREADGSVRDALSLLDQVLSLGKDKMSHQEVVELLGLVDRELVRATAQAVLEGDAGRVLDLVSQVYSAGGEMQAYYGALQEHFRNLAAVKAMPEGGELFGLTAEEVRELKDQVKDASPETLHEVFDHLARSEELFRRAGQPKLVMEMTLLKLTQVRPVLSLEEVIARLGQTAGTQEESAPPKTQPPKTPPPKTKPAKTQPAKPAPQNDEKRDSKVKGQAPASAQEALKELSRYAARTEPTLASYLGRAQARFEGSVMVITLPQGPLVSSLRNDNNQAKLSDLMAELFEQPFQIRLETAAAPSEPQPSGPSKAELAGELAEHPAVQEAVEVFEAQVVALNPSSPEK